jgi:VWFA-related protein
VRSLTLAAGVAVCAVVWLAPSPAARQATEQPPTFRAGVNFVRVDAYPTKDGKPVADLAKDEFEVLEDGVPQAIASFEHISIRRGVAPSERAEPRNTRESNQMAADPRNRLFVLFLDSYHVTDPTSWHDATTRMPGSSVARRPPEKKPLGQAEIDKAIVRFLNQAIGADDLVAGMSPELDVSLLTFTRRPATFEEWVSTVWGRRFSWDDLDPEEESWGLCYPPDDVGDPFGCWRGIFEDMVLRRREAKTLQALHDLVDRLADLREGRKAVIVISEGWPMYRPNKYLARAVSRVSTVGCPVQAPTGPGVTVGADGKLRIGDDPKLNPFSSDWGQCESSRVRMANLDNLQTYRTLLDRANRANVTFYPVDPRGLAVFDTPIDARHPGSIAPQVPTSMPQEDAALRGRLETLQNLASATDGSMTLTNDLTAAMKKISDDLSDYYLLGYNSTNQKLDGKFRKLTVRVKRPGVDVRARRGYLAPTVEEVKARASAEAALDPDLQARDRALTSLDQLRADRPLRVAAGIFAFAPPDQPDAASRPSLWAAGELDIAAARQQEWSDGGHVTVTLATPDGETIATEQVSVTPSARAFMVRTSDPRAAETDCLVRVRMQGRPGSGAEAVEQVRVNVPASGDEPSRLGDPVVLRRGPYSGPGFQPTADPRFRKAERIRVDVSAAAVPGSVTARLLDRKGLALPLAPSVGDRDEGGLHLLTAELALAPLAPGDYLVELAARFGAREERVFVAIRIVP